jgi:hypothetical protein
MFEPPPQCKVKIDLNNGTFRMTLEAAWLGIPGMTIRTAAVLTGGSLFLGGCWLPSPTYMFADKPKEAAVMLRLESVPPGAEAQASFGMSCHTPCILPLGGDGDFVVTFVRSGYLPVTVPITAQVPQERRPDSEVSLRRPAPRIVPNPVSVRLVRDPGARVRAAKTIRRETPAETETDKAPVLGPDPTD